MSIYCFITIVVCLIGSILAEDLKLLILHNNDIHARFEETARDSNLNSCKEKTSRTGRSQSRGCVGGIARTAHEIRRYRKMAERGQVPPVLYLYAGDTYFEAECSGEQKAKKCVEFLNILEPNATCLGNHDFDFGINGLKPFVDSAKFPILEANLDLSKEPSLASILKKSTILTVSGAKIGIIGHLTPETKEESSPGLVKFLDVVQSVKDESEILDKQGVKIIIVLGHSGYEVDKRIAAEVPLVDVVIGAHTHTFLWNGPPEDIEVPVDVYPKVITQTGGKKVPVVQGYAYNKYLGRLNLTFDKNGDLVGFEGQPELLETSIRQDGDVLDLLDYYHKIEASKSTFVGTSGVVLEADDKKCHFNECNFGNLIADSFVFYMASVSNKSYWTDYPISFINAGAFRKSIVGGNLTRENLIGAVPFTSKLVSFKLTGADLIQSLEIGNAGDGIMAKRTGFLQVSGLHVVYDINKPKFSRVVSVKVRCGQCKVPKYEDLELDKEYGVVTVNFLTNGGDGHVVLRDKGINKQILNVSSIDAIEWYLKRYSTVYPEEEERITFVKGDSKDKKNSS